jgi:hypothetical protein
MKIKLQNVRLSFPSLFKAKAVNDGEPRFSCSLLLNKKEDAAQIDVLRKGCIEVAHLKWGPKLPKGLTYPVKDGSTKDYDGYTDKIMFISASNQHRPSVVDRDLDPLAEEDGKPYAGCYVNAVIRLWAQDNKWGKKINAQLCGVQFSTDGEAFGEKPFVAQEEFDALEQPKGQASFEREPGDEEEESEEPPPF